ncbi:MAG: PD-(D/E)XK nuclease-like domain-containing protein [Planctomycetaceae bacterium]|jgi:hypothetical protein|nr:PD-(D/E)XK nuclease-like domain-containing protein [Planctomycetaceae bacterium]
MIEIDYKKILMEEPFAVYLSKRTEYLTSHQLADFIRCPKLYYLKKTGALTTDPNKTSSELITGSAAHKLILEGRQEFDKCYAVGAPINPKTGNEYGRETQAFAKWEEEQHREKGTQIEFLTTTQWYTVSSMADSVAKHAEAQKLLHHGVAERVLRSDFGGIPVQSRLDWFTEIGETPVIVDLKTCSDLDSFEYDARKFMYGYQFSFYRHILLRSIFDEYDIDNAIPAKVYVIAVEKKPPFRCGVFEVSEVSLGHFTEQLLVSIAALGNCQKTGSYPTLYEATRTLNL